MESGRRLLCSESSSSTVGAGERTTGRPEASSGAVGAGECTLGPGEGAVGGVWASDGSAICTRINTLPVPRTVV